MRAVASLHAVLDAITLLGCRGFCFGSCYSNHLRYQWRALLAIGGGVRQPLPLHFLTCSLTQKTFVGQENRNLFSSRRCLSGCAPLPSRVSGLPALGFDRR
jgi:hypothetical protein